MWGSIPRLSAGARDRPAVIHVGGDALYGERPSGLALAGALLIGVGAFFLAGAEEPQATPSDDGSSKAIVYGLLTGGFDRRLHYVGQVRS